MLVIGIAGRAGSGKDTVADMLREHHGFTVVGFADPLKRFMMDTFGFSERQLWGPSQNRNEPDHRWLKPDGTYLTPREALQTLATEWGRKLAPDFLVRYMQRILEMLAIGTCTYRRTIGLAADMHATAPAGIAIPDLRHDEELPLFDNGCRWNWTGQTWRVERPGNPDRMPAAFAGHPTEHGLTKPLDLVIQNDGTLGKLQRRVDDCVQALAGKA